MNRHHWTPEDVQLCCRVYVPDGFSMDGNRRIVEAGFYLRMEKTAQGFASLINGHCSSGTIFPNQSLASLKRGDLCYSNE